MFTFFNKTKTKNTSILIQQIDTIDENIIIPLLNSSMLSEGVSGFEVISFDDIINYYLFTPSFIRLKTGIESVYDPNYLLNDLENILCYDISLLKPSFLPLYTKESISLLQEITFLKLPKTVIHIQLIFTKRTDQWQDDLINQYEYWLCGNDYPAQNKIQRKMQQKFIDVISKFSGYDFYRKPVNEIEQKLLDIGYRFELRLIAKTNDKELFKNEINKILKEMNFFNELTLQEIPKTLKKQFVNDFINHRLSKQSENVVISGTELLCLLGIKKITENRDTVQLNHNTLTNKPYYTKLINLLPTGEKIKREIDENIVDELPLALKKAKAIKNHKLEIVNVELGATVQQITFKIPNGIVFSDIKSRYEDIKAALGTDLNIIQGKDANTITFLITCDQRETIYLKELLSHQDFIEFAENHQLPFVCGIDMYNQPVYKCLTTAPHLLIAGATNSGKSVMINTILTTLILLKSPQDLRLILIDPKKIEFSVYEGLAHVEKVITDMNESVQVLNDLVNEMERRYEKFHKLGNGIKNIIHYNNKSKTKIPYIICVIDEYNDLIMTHDVEQYIERLGQKARACGIHLIIATQRPDKNVMSGVIKTNLPSRISFKLDNANEYKTVFGTGIPYKNLLGFGDGVVKYVGQMEEFIRFQAPVITLDEFEEEEFFKKIKKAFKNETFDRIEFNETIEENLIDKLKRIIATTGETRICELRKEMGIRINVVQELMKQLVNEGFLSKDGRSYVISANEDELKKWKSY